MLPLIKSAGILFPARKAVSVAPAEALQSK